MSDPLWKRIKHTGYVKPYDRKIGQVYTSLQNKTGIWDGKILRCKHYRQQNICKECGGVSVCEHNILRYECIECEGVSICEHKRRRRTCIECVGSCIHGNTRTTCKKCTAVKQ